jgi:hypothetical protein
MNREPVGQSLNSMRLTLEELAGMVRDPVRRAEIEAEAITLGQIAFRANLILSFLETYKPQKRWVGR